MRALNPVSGNMTKFRFLFMLQQPPPHLEGLHMDLVAVLTSGVSNYCLCHSYRRSIMPKTWNSVSVGIYVAPCLECRHLLAVNTATCIGCESPIAPQLQPQTNICIKVLSLLTAESAGVIQPRSGIAEAL
ncbi:uncharacterized protein AAGF69_017183 isoform 2-T2 [Amazona ochrocephala]